MAEGIYHTVTEGECISSLAEGNGLFWKTVWEHNENATLRQQRRDPNVLMPGDVVFIPARRLGEHAGSTEQRHTFRHKGTPAKIMLRFQREGQPRANVRYVLVVDGRVSEGRTDSDGIVRAPIPPTAREATITLRENDQEEAFQIGLGHMDPINEESGARKRLNNLGFNAGTGDHDQFVAALKKFQLNSRLKVTGELDAATQDKLREAHGV